MYKETFPERLTTARKKTGFTQNEISEGTGIPRSTLANYEAGRTEPDIENLCKLIDFYGISANAVLGTQK